MADSNDVDSVQPEDFTVFSVNQQCVTSRDTYFQVPQDMPSCSQDWCLCAWSWSVRAFPRSHNKGVSYSW